VSKRKPSLPGVDAIFGSNEPPKPKPLEPPAAEVTKPSNASAKKKTFGTAGKKTVKPAAKKKIMGESNATSGPRPGPNSTEAASSHNGDELQKYTLYIYPSIEEKLEEVWYKLRRKRKEKIPKWKIVNVILEKHLGDMEQIEKLLEG